jgi:hypothetical protein
MKRRNPELEELDYEYGEWIPAHAIMFNDDGSVSLIREPAENPEYHPDRVVHWTMSDEEMQDTPHRMQGDFAVLDSDGSLWLWDRRFDHWGKFSGPGKAGAPPHRLLNRGRRTNPDRPVIHIYGEPGNWTYSLVMSYVGREEYQTYSHHYDKAFKTIEAAEQHARDHIGKPHYGGEFGTVLNWDRPIVQLHDEEEGYEGAGIYGGGPPKWATRLNRGRKRR